MNNRSGVFTQDPSGYKYFVPHKLPPSPPLKMDEELISCLSYADRKLGRRDGVTQILPNPDLFVAMYVKKEALLSSQIEGTQASLIDVINVDDESKEKRVNIQEVINYVAAMNHGLIRLQDFPISLRLIREIHAVLLRHGRGSLRTPGEFRTSQNWIGPSGCDLNNAIFVPPNVPHMHIALNDLELFFYDEHCIPPLIKIAMIHAQFETIHPFLDGNGRMGRLLITFWLCNEQILSKPLLYLSYYFKQNRTEYYDRLMDVRTKGDWEGWIKFFLKGIADVSDEATNSAKQIISLKESTSQMLYEKHSSNNTYQRLLDYLFEYPSLSVNTAKDLLQVSYPTASAAIAEFCKLGILRDATPRKERGKLFLFNKYMTILERGTE